MPVALCVCIDRQLLLAWLHVSGIYNLEFPAAHIHYLYCSVGPCQLNDRLNISLNGLGTA